MQGPGAAAAAATAPTRAKCIAFNETGHCRFGDDCRFLHVREQKVSAGMMAGKTISVEVAPRTTVLAVLHELHEREGILSEWAQLRYQSWAMDEKATLSAYKLGEGSVIDLVRRDKPMQTLEYKQHVPDEWEERKNRSAVRASIDEPLSAVRFPAVLCALVSAYLGFDVSYLPAPEFQMYIRLPFGSPTVHNTRTAAATPPVRDDDDADVPELHDGLGAGGGGGGAGAAAPAAAVGAPAAAAGVTAEAQIALLVATGGLSEADANAMLAALLEEEEGGGED